MSQNGPNLHVDKSFDFFVPMKSKGEFPSTLKLFAKEIEVPTTLILDTYIEQTSQKVRKFCNNLGTTLRILEEHNQWANLAELYIGLTKESIRKRIIHLPDSLGLLCQKKSCN